MKYWLHIIILIAAQQMMLAQSDSIVVTEPATLDVQFLITEALMNNPEIRSEVNQMDVMQARVSQAAALDDPEFTFMSEEMPGFRFNEALYHKFGLTQALRFPSKLNSQERLAEIRADHAHHDHQERMNDVIARLKSAYDELWFVQQEIILQQENIRLMQQFSQIALTRYGLGEGQQQDVIKARIELAVLNNGRISLRQQELSAKAMLMSILNRSAIDTLGYAAVAEEVSFDVPLDSLIAVALVTRPMLVHDSLAIEESTEMLSLAKKEYVPDLKVGIEYVTMPISGMNSWSVSAGLTLPFAPWTSGRANGRVDEATAEIKRNIAALTASRNMVIASVRDLYYKATAGKEQLDNFRTIIIPGAEQGLKTSLSAYETGTLSFLMLLDAYKTRINLMTDYFMVRMRFEQSIASLERETGRQNILEQK